MNFTTKIVKQTLKDPSRFQSRMLLQCGSRMALVGDNGKCRWEAQ